MRITIENGQQSGASPTAGATHSGSDIDSRVESIRVLGYRVSNGTLAFNQKITVSDPDAGYAQGTIQVLTSSFDFVFIANEGTDTSLPPMLDDDNYVGTFGGLCDLSFDADSFLETKAIPMVSMIEGVRVLGENTVQVDSYIYSDIWNVGIDRLAIRLELELEMPDDFATAAELSFGNVPDRVYLIQDENIATVNDVTRTFTPDSKQSDMAGTTTMKWERIILPESWFVDAGKEENGVEVRLTNSGDTKKATLGVDPGTDYTMPRNTYFGITGTVSTVAQEEIDITVEAKAWDLIYADTTGIRSLNVSAVKASVNEHNMARIFFWSDTEDVYLDELTSNGDPVVDLFYGLTGSDVSNFHYTWDASAGEGTGYFDVVADRNLTGSGYYGTHGLLLTTGDGLLKREIQVELTVPSSDFAAYDYVGAFWRNDQRGERLIVLANTGTWTAKVVSGTDWIELEASKTLDTNVWAGDEPEDAEKYPVYTGLTEVSGSGLVFLRIGLTEYNYTGSNRYGLVTVTTSDGDKNIYIRQGKDADYLMAPTDAATTWSGDRSLAAKFSPYNLTAPQFKSGSTTDYVQLDAQSATSGGGVFTDYPSQAGALFQWASDVNPCYAYHPTATPTVWDATSASQYWSAIGSANETCPPGYRRPTDGRISTDTGYNIEDSEFRQSLWLNPQTQTEPNIDNVIWGYYADGFFDRRQIVSASYGYAVSRDGGDSRVGYTGMLFYNPDSKASLFFPALGYRTVSGNLSADGMMGYYWTASSKFNNGIFNGSLLSFSYMAVNGMVVVFIVGPNTDQIMVGGRIRCVYDPQDDSDLVDPYIWTLDATTGDERILAEADALSAGLTGSEMMTWAEAMGINTKYNADWFYTSGYSSYYSLPAYFAVANFDYSYGHAGATDAGTGCAAYYEGDADDPVTGKGKWFLPTWSEISTVSTYLEYLNDGTLTYGYLCSLEDIEDEYYMPIVVNKDAIVWRLKTDTRYGYTRCVRYPTAEELEVHNLLK